MSNTVPRPLPIDPDGTFDSRYWLRDDPLAMGPQGPEGPIGPQGIQGPRGDEGQSVRIRYVVASALDLPATNIVIGDGALVGVTDPYDLYVYTDDPPSWYNAGPVTAGPQGEQGPVGPAGPQPPLSGSGVATTAAKSDHNHDGIYSPVTHVHDAAVITSGTLSADRIPGLDGSKIAAGTVPVERLPLVPTTQITGVLPSSQVASLDAGKTTTGTFTVDRLPSLDASKTTTGTFSIDRIPSLPTSQITTGTFPLARLPGIPASHVTTGTFAKGRIPVMALTDLFPNNTTSTTGSSSMRVAPGNVHAALGALGNGWGLHDTGFRQNTDEMWAYVMIPGIGFCWIPENRI